MNQLEGPVMSLHTRIVGGDIVTIATDFWAKPIPDRSHDWSAVDDQKYDGAPDSGPQMIGWGATEADAIADLMSQIEDATEERAS